MTWRGWFAVAAGVLGILALVAEAGDFDAIGVVVLLAVAVICLAIASLPS